MTENPLVTDDPCHRVRSQPGIPGKGLSVQEISEEQLLLERQLTVVVSVLTVIAVCVSWLRRRSQLPAELIRDAWGFWLSTCPSWPACYWVTSGAAPAAGLRDCWSRAGWAAGLPPLPLAALY